jgi:hypothetical protein
VFFARAFRLFAYRGSMREELLIERSNNEENSPAPRAASPQPTAQDDGGTRWVSPEQMLAIYNNPELGRR